MNTHPHTTHTHTTHNLYYLNFMKLLSDNHDRKVVMGRGVKGRQMTESGVIDGEGCKGEADDGKWCD